MSWLNYGTQSLITNVHSGPQWSILCPSTKVQLFHCGNNLPGRPSAPL